jgi:hypothetical protein
MPTHCVTNIATELLPAPASCARNRAEFSVPMADCPEDLRDFRQFLQEHPGTVT